MLTLFCRLILDIPKSINFEEEDAMLLNFEDLNNTILYCKIQFVNLFKHEVIPNDVYVTQQHASQQRGKIVSRCQF